MAHVIALPCIGVKDGGCVEVCPTDAIHPHPGTPQFPTVDQLFINPNVCTDCGQCVGVCPVNAIFPSNALPAQWEPYIAKNRNYFT